MQRRRLRQPRRVPSSCSWSCATPARSAGDTTAAAATLAGAATSLTWPPCNVRLQHCDYQVPCTSAAREAWAAHPGPTAQEKGGYARELEELIPQLEALMDEKATLEQAAQAAQAASQAAEQHCASLEAQARPDCRAWPHAGVQHPEGATPPCILQRRPPSADARLEAGAAGVRLGGRSMGCLQAAQQQARAEEGSRSSAAELATWQEHAQQLEADLGAARAATSSAQALQQVSRVRAAAAAPSAGATSSQRPGCQACLRPAWQSALLCSAVSMSHARLRLLSSVPLHD